jgi:hypothetical protein
MRSVARRFRVSLCTVQRWVARARGKRLDRVDLADRPGGCRVAPRRTSAALEDLILATRADLRTNGDLGEYGAAAVRDHLAALKVVDLPSLRTIHRVFERRGALDGRHRVRRPAPPPGWYLPDLAARRAELDSFDIVEGLVIGKRAAGTAASAGGPRDVEVLNAVSLHGGLVGSWPTGVVTARFAADCLVARWRVDGLPAYAQFDNDTVFQGAHQWPDSFGRVTRLCLSLGVVPVFAPPREPGFQAAIENLNGRWQAKVWARFTHPSLAALVERSDRFVAAARLRSAPRIESAPARRPFPPSRDWPSMASALGRALRGRVVFLRRSDADGRVTVLGRTHAVDRSWPGRLVRVDVDLDAREMRFHALRRRDPANHRLLRTLTYAPPSKPFKE